METLIAAWGVPGVIVIAVVLQLLKKEKRLDEVMDKRLEESRETITSIQANTAALNALSEVVRSRSNA